MSDQASIVDLVLHIATTAIGVILVVSAVYVSYGDDYPQATYLLVFGWFMFWQGSEFK